MALGVLIGHKLLRIYAIGHYFSFLASDSSDFFSFVESESSDFSSFFPNTYLYDINGKIEFLRPPVCRLRPCTDMGDDGQRRLDYREEP